MKYGKPLSQKDLQQSFHRRCKAAADDLAKGKSHILMLNQGDNYETFCAQVRVFLCACHQFSANDSADLIEKHLQVSIPQISTCISGRM
ncbi:hypothetical protein JAVIER_55 [Vibrio phage Javier]|uniref:Uncharacterized protein n=2 Tax=Thalassavirus TaxID=2948922 RepID=A0A6M4ES46_9CAUD|nr:hypothetical protein KNU58_gp051 [Vibrio phage Brizo]YP_010105652.1 hypothetical protein KNU87_gp059 [Vibrio phage Bennett]QIG66373.1 hypothetical protein CHAZLY21_60 [Vibrio phage Chazly21]QKE60922.1 hypothetical protein DAX_61 [Vibrio phage Dax]QKN85502.1 hypothetical protein DIREPILLOW8_63 [Vibrio phage Direpillow8]WBF69429.1 hypothetical protein IW18_58 [Vibrio phage IW18]WBU76298.1 hypothetical protein WYMAN_59 [Vibrio phage Wyman]WBU76674.1 hypothetical protein JAVIER_55 [Vibrio pha